MKKYWDDGTCIILPDSLIEFVESHTTKQHMDLFEDITWEYVPPIEKENDMKDMITPLDFEWHPMFCPLAICEFDNYLEKSGWRKHLKKEYKDFLASYGVSNINSMHKHYGIYLGNPLKDVTEMDMVMVLCQDGRYYYVYEKDVEWKYFINNYWNDYENETTKKTSQGSEQEV